MGRKLVRILLWVGGAAIMLAMSLSIVGAWLFAPSHDDVTTLSSPEGKFVATLTEVNGAATTSFGYVVRVAEVKPSGTSQEVARLYGALRNTSAYGANLRWLSESELVIEYMSARHAEVSVAAPVLGGTQLRVAFRSNVTDLTAPSGGMLYNKKKGQGSAG